MNAPKEKILKVGLGCIDVTIALWREAANQVNYSASFLTIQAGMRLFQDSTRIFRVIFAIACKLFKYLVRY